MTSLIQHMTIGISAKLLYYYIFDLTSLSLSGRNEVSTVGFLPSFLFLTTGEGGATREHGSVTIKSNKKVIIL